MDTIRSQSSPIVINGLASVADGGGRNTPFRPPAQSVVAAPTDRRGADGMPQSGLPYYWRDGRPLFPEPTLAFRAQQAIKRCIDVVGASLALVILGPFLLAIAVLIKRTSPGPVLFRQTRTGRNGEPFVIFKFRTLYADQGDASGIAQTQPGDTRITPIGAVLRARSLDEFPQLINVLRGEMSLIGPRPHPIGMKAGGMLYEELVPYYHYRHAVRPGLSGWAQANGLRGPTTDASKATARIDHDIAYIQNFSLWLDLVALLRTLRNEFFTGTRG